MAASNEQMEKKYQKAIVIKNTAQELFEKINVGEEIMLTVYTYEHNENKVGARKKIKIVRLCEVVQKNKYCLFVRFNNRIKCVTESDIITGECRIMGVSDEVANY